MNEKELIKRLTVKGVPYRIEYDYDVDTVLKEYPCFKRLLKNDTPGYIVVNNHKINLLMGYKFAKPNKKLSPYMINIILDRFLYNEQKLIKELKDEGIIYRIEYMSEIPPALKEYPCLRELLVKNTDDIFDSVKINKVMNSEFVHTGDLLSSYKMNIVLDRILSLEENK